MEPMTDRFLCEMYAYHSKGGYGEIVVRQLCELAWLGFSVVVSTVLLACVHWGELLTLQERDEGHHDPISWTEFVSWRHTLEGGAAIVVLRVSYFVALSLVWGGRAALLAMNAPFYLRQHRLFTQTLRIPEHRFGVTPWRDVVQRIAEQTPNATSLTPLSTAQRVLRRQNYLVGMMRDRVLRFEFRGYPLWSRYTRMAVDTLVLRPLFDSSNRLICDPLSFRHRCRALGLLVTLTLPLTLVFTTITFFFEHADELHTRTARLGAREWSGWALWGFRRYNEYPKDFEARVQKSLPHARRYIREFPSPVSDALSSLATFVVGGTLGVVALTGLLNDAVLTEVGMLGHSLLWWVAVLSGAVACTRACSSSLPTKPLEHHLTAVVSHTGVELVPEYRERARYPETYAALARLFRYRFVGLAETFATLVLMPWWLCVHLPSHADALYVYLRQNTVSLEGVGDVHRHSAESETVSDPAVAVSDARLTRSMQSTERALGHAAMRWSADTTTGTDSTQSLLDSILDQQNSVFELTRLET